MIWALQHCYNGKSSKNSIDDVMISQMIEKSISLDANWKIYQIEPLYNGKMKTRFKKSTVESSITLKIG